MNALKDILRTKKWIGETGWRTDEAQQKPRSI